MNKVYCKNCKFNNDIVWIERCLSVAVNLKTELEPGKFLMTDDIQADANKNNDCILYKRKWWKVWLK